jgi:hypothetical protein
MTPISFGMSTPHASRVHKLIRLEPVQAKRVADYRHAQQYRFEIDAIKFLIDAGLDAVEAARRKPEATAA